MPLIVAPALNADSYVALVEADAWHTDRGHAAWTGADGVKETALRRATSWIDATFGFRFSGAKASGRAQSLAWPRIGATDADGLAISSDEIPVEIKRATFEAALRELVSPGSLNPDIVPVTTTGGAVKRVRKKVGPLETETEYTEGGSSEMSQPIFPVIEGILAGLIGRGFMRPAIFVV